MKAAPAAVRLIAPVLLLMLNSALPLPSQATNNSGFAAVGGLANDACAKVAVADTAEHVAGRLAIYAIKRQL